MLMAYVTVNMVCACCVHVTVNREYACCFYGVCHSGHGVCHSEHGVCHNELGVYMLCSWCMSQQTR